MTAHDGTGAGPVATAPVGTVEPVNGASDEVDHEVLRLRRRVAELEQPRRTRHRVRQTLAVVLAVLTVIAIVATSVATWTTRTALDTDRFMGIVGPVLASPEVSAAISVRVTQETITALALEDRLDARLADLQATLGDELASALDVDASQRARVQSLPLPQLQDLAGPIASGLEARIATRIDQFVSSPEFERLLVEGTTLAHTKAVALLRGDMEELPNVEVQAGEVRLNLVPVVAGVLEDLVDQGLAAVGIEEIPFIDPFADPQVSLQRLESALGTDLPDDFGQLTVMSQAELEELQAAARAADQLVWVLLVVSIVLLALTVAAAPRRRRTLVQVALGTAAGSVVTMALLRNAADDIAATAATSQGSAALQLLADATLDSLRSTMVVVLVVALVVAAVGYLLGRPAWLLRTIAATKRMTTPKPGGSDLQRFVVDHHDVLQVAVVAVAVLLLFIVGIGFWSMIIIAGLVLLTLWGLSAAHSHAPTADVAHEEPDDEPPVVADAAGQDETLTPSR